MPYDTQPSGTRTIYGVWFCLGPEDQQSMEAKQQVHQWLVEKMQSEGPKGSPYHKVDMVSLTGKYLRFITSNAADSLPLKLAFEKKTPAFLDFRSPKTEFRGLIQGEYMVAITSYPLMNSGKTKTHLLEEAKRDVSRNLGLDLSIGSLSFYAPDRIIAILTDFNMVVHLYNLTEGFTKLTNMNYQRKSWRCPSTYPH